VTAGPDFDVIVVGGGAAGLAAASTAGALGMRVLLVESERQIGGSSRLSDAILQAAGTAQQRASGMHDSPHAMFEYYMTLNRWQIEPGLARAFCDDAPVIVEWLETLGITFGPVERAGNVPVWRGHPTIGMGEALIEALDAECRRRDVELALDNRVDGLLVDDGRVAGVRARGEDATASAVVLAAGGFAHNPELIRRYLGGRMLAGDHPSSPAGAGSRGDALVLGEAVGAGIAGRDRAHWVPGPMVPPEVVLLNGDGRRFVDESADHSVRTIVANYHGHTYFALFDEAIRRTGAADSFVARTDAAFLFGADPVRFDVEPVATWVRGGAVAQGDTVGEAVVGVGLDPEAATAAVHAYNDACARGHDVAFEKAPASLVPISNPPFYAVRIQPRMLVATFCGLRIDADARVLDTSGRVLPGLFAAGESAGGVVGDVYAGHGNSITTALVFGRRAGRGAAALAAARPR
jgi:fumarate reductase flavoprotein subunit